MEYGQNTFGTHLDFRNIGQWMENRFSSTLTKQMLIQSGIKLHLVYNTLYSAWGWFLLLVAQNIPSIIRYNKESVEWCSSRTAFATCKGKTINKKNNGIRCWYLLSSQFKGKYNKSVKYLSLNIFGIYVSNVKP